MSYKGVFSRVTASRGIYITSTDANKNTCRRQTKSTPIQLPSTANPGPPFPQFGPGVTEHTGQTIPFTRGRDQRLARSTPEVCRRQRQQDMLGSEWSELEAGTPTSVEKGSNYSAPPGHF